jgi:hypothetical protein
VALPPWSSDRTSREEGANVIHDATNGIDFFFQILHITNHWIGGDLAGGTDKQKCEKMTIFGHIWTTRKIPKPVAKMNSGREVEWH